MKDDTTTSEAFANHRRAPETDDAGGMVERLLHAAGPGPDVPGNGAARVKDVIRPIWKGEVAARSRQRTRLWIGGAAAAAALVIAGIYLPSLRTVPVEPESHPIVVAMIAGTIEMTPPGSTVEFLTANDAGVEIPRGSLIRTRSEGRVAMWLANDRSLRLDSDTDARLDSEASISLESGAVYVDSADGHDSSIEVRTALGTAHDIGTQFEVRLEHRTLDVRVREGMVALNRGDEEYQINQGITLSVDTDGAVSTGAITPFDPVWAWTQEIAPSFEIEGRSVLAFLDWVSSETGLSVRFSDTDLEQLAAATLLHGTINGLPPAETPAAVLPTCGLRAVESPGALLITRLEGNAARP
jgi:hypothetical protein